MKKTELFRLLAVVLVAEIAVTYVAVGGVAGYRRDPTTAIMTISVILVAMIIPVGFGVRRILKQTAAAPEALDVASPAITGSQFPSLAPNAGAMPHEVRHGGWSLFSRIAGYGLYLVLALFVLVVSQVSGPWRVDTILVAAPAAAVAAFCAYGLWRLRQPWLILYADRLELCGLTGPRTVRRDEIEGVRDAGSDRGGALFEIVPRTPGAARIILRQSVRQNDPIVRAWFSGVRDMTAEAKAADRASILADSRYGETAHARERRLKTARFIAIGFNIACIGEAAWLFVSPPPYLAMLLLALAPLPLAAVIVTASQGLILWINRAGVRPAIAGAIVPLAAVAFWCVLSLHIPSPWPLIEPAAILAVGAAGVTVTRWTGPRRILITLAAGVAAGVLAYGLAGLVDVAFDRAAGTVIPSVIQDAYISSGRSPTPYLRLAPSPQPDGSAVRVSRDLYDKVAIGQRVCVHRRPGALGVAWYDLDLCQAGTPPANP